MSLPSLAIRRPVFAWMLMAALFVFGGISFGRLGVSLLPDVDFPVVSVSFSLSGAAPEVIEAQVLDPVEDAIMELGGIRSINSTAQQSSGSVSVEFEVNQNIDIAMQAIQNKINQVSNLLPLNLRPPTLRKTNPEDQPIMWLGVTSADPSTLPIDLMNYARNDLYGQFSSITGVGNIILGGYVEPALRVWTSNQRLKDFNLTAEDVLSAIQQEQIEVPAGLLHNHDQEWFVRTLGEARSPESFGRLTIHQRLQFGASSKPIRLDQVATIEEGLSDVRRKCRLDGVRTVGLGLIKQHGSNAVEVANLIRAKVSQLKPLLKAPFHLAIRSDNTVFIKKSVKQLIFTLSLSALLTSVVCYLFLGSLSSTINVVLAIPTSIIGTFIVFYAFHFTLNTFTLLGLSLAIGIVVDDAIMMLENIVRYRELGFSKRQAALKGAEEISFAALAATLAVVAIFLPVVFMKGIIGRYFLQFGVTVTAAVLLSLLEALTLTPMRCARFLSVTSHPTTSPDAGGKLRGWQWSQAVDRFFARLSHLYLRILAVLLRHRVLTLAVTLMFFAASLRIAKLLPSEMMPLQDQSLLLLRFKLPVGSSIEQTDGVMQQVETHLLTLREVEGIFSVVGGFGGDAVNQGTAFLTLKDPEVRKISQNEFAKVLRKQLKQGWPGAEIVVQDLSMRGFAASRGFPVEFIVQGSHWQQLMGVTQLMIEKMKASGTVTDVNTDVQAGMPEVQIIPDRKKLAAHGVSLKAVTSVINSLLGGAILVGQNEYQKGRHRYEIELRLVAKDRSQIVDLQQVRVRNNRGETVPLSALVHETSEPSLMLISRLNRVRAITVYANPAPGVSQQEALQKVEKLARSLLPPGFLLKMTGSSQSFRESFQSLLVALLLGILVSYMVLASQFNSFVHPVTVLMALPFSISGAFIGLWLGHQSINMYSMIGFILLMGIVKKNSILLVDFTNQMRLEGHSVREALLKACPVRLRPILMTSAATVAGALPEALSLGPGSETTIPMATALIGGVIASTFLTLFVVPCCYSLFAIFEQKDVLE